MEISRLMMPVALLAGALALAGCSGGNDNNMTTEKTETEETPTPTTTTETEPDKDDMTPDKEDGAMAGTMLRLPGNAAVRWGDGPGQVNGDVQIAAGQVLELGGAWFRCPADGADCVIQEGTGRTVEVTYTGGPLTVHASDPRNDRTPVRPESGDWLSSASLVGSVPASGDLNSLSFTIGGVRQTIAANGTPITDAEGYDPGIDRLSIWHNRSLSSGRTNRDFLVWGAWQETVPRGMPSAKPVFKQEWGGSVHYSGTVAQTGDATYTGEDQAGGFYKRGNGGWTAWTGDVVLLADFEKGNISGRIGTGAINGTIDTSASGLTGVGPFMGSNFANSGSKDDNTIGGISHISLMPAPIGSSVRGGKVKIVGITGVENAPSSGKWSADYFGPASGSMPTGIAGGFSAVRPAAKAKAGSAAPADDHAQIGNFEINGAFGATR